MNKTIKVNLGGFVFQLDEDAYELLKDYLLQLERKFDNSAEGNEIIEDIERRIAELLSSKLIEGREVVNVNDVKEIIETMGSPEEYGDDETNNERPRTRVRGKLYREPNNAVVGGVASGIATHINVSPAWVRLAFLLTLFAWTFGFWAYLIMWAILPKNPSPIMRVEPEENALADLLNRVFFFLGKVVKFFVRFVAIVLGVSFILAGFPVLVALLGVSVFPMFDWLVIGDWGMTPQEVYSFANFAMLENSSILTMVLVAIVVIVPMLMLTYWGVRLVLWIRVKDAWLHITAGVLFLVASILLGIALTPNVRMFIEDERSYDRVDFVEAPDTLTLMLNDVVDEAIYPESIIFPDGDAAFYYNEKKKISCGLVELEFNQNTKDSMAYFRIKKEAMGPTRSRAYKNLGEIDYAYISNETHLALDQTYSSSNEKYPWIPSHVEVDIFVPESTVLVIDKRLKDLPSARHSLFQLDNEIIYINMN